MKKFISLFSVFIISVLGFTVSVSAADFSAYNSGSESNRVFPLEIYLSDESASFCSAIFEVEFEASVLGFRGVKTEISGAEVYSYDGEGKVAVLFLSDDPLPYDIDTPILSVDFICKDGGKGSFDITVKGAVDANADPMDTNLNFSCPYEIVKSASGSFSVSSSKSSNFKIKTSSGKNSGQSKNTENSDETEEALTESANKTNITLNAVSNGGENYIIAAVVLVGFFIILAIIKYLKLKKDSVPNDSEKND